MKKSLKRIEAQKMNNFLKTYAQQSASIFYKKAINDGRVEFLKRIIRFRKPSPRRRKSAAIQIWDELKKPKTKLVHQTCYLSGRNRGINQRFGVSRLIYRALIKKGVLNGLRKSSW